MARIEWSAVGRGALAGVGILAPLALILLLLDRVGLGRGLRGAIALLVGMAAFVVAGALAGLLSSAAPRSTGLLAGAGALTLWAVLLLVISLVRRALGSTASGLGLAGYLVSFGAYLVLAAGCGVLGGTIGARMTARDGE
jgi:hypothetical protein